MIELMTKIPVETAMNWVNTAREAARVEDLEETEGYVPFPRGQLQRIINAFDQLHVRPEWRLDPYIWRFTTMGGGLIMPRGREHPQLEPVELPDPQVPSFTKPWVMRKPHHVLLLTAGEGTPQSFLQASLLSRELHELGAFYETLRWHDHQLVNRAPDVPEPSDFDPVQTKRLVRFPSPEDLSPRVRRYAGGVEVIFYTTYANEPGQLFRFNDRYVPGKGYCYLATQTLVVDVFKSRRALTGEQQEQAQREPEVETEVVYLD